MFGHVKVKLDKGLWQKVEAYARAAGYASADEFVVHAVERQLAHLEEGDHDEAFRRKLRGLGYIS